MPSGTSSTTTRPCTPNGQEKEEMEVLEARTSNFTRLWKTDLDIRGPRREWTCFVQPPSRDPSSSSDVNTDPSAHAEAAALGAYTIGM